MSESEKDLLEGKPQENDPNDQKENIDLEKQPLPKPIPPHEEHHPEIIARAQKALKALKKIEKEGKK